MYCTRLNNLQRHLTTKILNRTLISTTKKLIPVKNGHFRCQMYSKYSTSTGTTWDKWFDDSNEIITMPTALERKLEKIRLKKGLKAEKERLWRGSGKLIVSCKREVFNHRIGQTYPPGELDLKYLASGGWKSKKSNDDWFIIHPFSNHPAFQFESEISDFASLGVKPEVEKILNRSLLLKEPTYVQEKGIPQILSGTNTLLAAETGSGKTLAYLVPIIQKILKLKSINNKKALLGLVIVPSYELVEQISSVAKKLCEPLNLKVVQLTGNGEQPDKTSDSHADLLVATPGILMRMVNYKIYDLNQVEFLVLDEGDTLMDDSFNDLVVNLLQKMNIQTEHNVAENVGAQVIISGATLPKDLSNILGELVDTDAIVSVTAPKLHHVPTHVKQVFTRVKPSRKSDLVLDRLKANHAKSRPTLVFCNKSASVSHLSWRLDELNIHHSVLTKHLSSQKRNGSFESFQSGKSNLLIATDLASRGLDTTSVQHVINYEFPDFLSDYIHRVGRVGRIGSPARCMASSYLSHRWEIELLWKIESAIRKGHQLQGVDANITRVLSKSDKRFEEIPEDMNLAF